MLDCFSSFVDVFALRDGYDSFGWVFLEAKTEGIGEENWGWIKFLRGMKLKRTVDYYDVIVANILNIANNGNRIEIIQKKKVEVGEYLENIGEWKIYHARDKRLAV